MFNEVTKRSRHLRLNLVIDEGNRSSPITYESVNVDSDSAPRISRLQLGGVLSDTFCQSLYRHRALLSFDTVEILRICRLPEMSEPENYDTMLSPISLCLTRTDA